MTEYIKWKKEKRGQRGEGLAHRSHMRGEAMCRVKAGSMGLRWGQGVWERTS